jgi:DUF4097 and DUF4098 domain-containing protein YvlB
MEPRTFDVTGRLHLIARMRSGDVTISARESAKASVHVTGERHPDEVSIACDASSGGTRLQVVQRKEGWGFRSRGVHVDVVVPHGTIVDVGTGSGDVTIEGRVAELRLQSGSGDASVAGVDGRARLRNASGDVRVDTVGGDLVITTASGEIEVGSVAGGFEARTASGDIEVGATDGPARAVSASGDITIGSAGGDVHLRSVSGDIEVGVPSGVRVWFDISSTSGDARSDLDPGDGRDPADAHFEIRATSVSGDVHLRRAPARDAVPA